MIHIGIDPGTFCGWAVCLPGESWHSGVWDLSSSRWEGGGMRYLRLRRLFGELLDSLPDDEGVVVAYEEVRRHLGTDAAHVYGGIVAVITEECERRGITTYTGVPVGAVKRTATGKGNASKEAMIAAARGYWARHSPATGRLTPWEPADDNEADARWIAEYSRQQEVAA